MSLRRWQSDALAAFMSSEGDFLAVATPGAGKTRFALSAARETHSRRRLSAVVAVVPTARLKLQWQRASKGYDLPGVRVLTYQELACMDDHQMARVSGEGTLAILDEIHHCGDQSTWGSAIGRAFSVAARRLLLSGTPWRTEGTPIPFVRYLDGQPRADFRYGFQQAVQDGYVRPVRFKALDGLEQDTRARRLSEVGVAEIPAALAGALDREGPWIRSALSLANDELTRARRERLDAGGLVIAGTQEAARGYAEFLTSLTGEDAALVIADAPQAHDALEEFAAGTRRWLVSVQMVSEGIDIPRLTVLLYATNKRTEKYFAQATGRVVRRRVGRDVRWATVLLPSVKPLLKYAARMGQIEHIRLADEPAARAAGAGIGRGSRRNLRIGEAMHYSTIDVGDPISDGDLRRASECMEMLGIDADPELLVRFSRLLRLREQQDADIRAALSRLAPGPRPLGSAVATVDGSADPADPLRDDGGVRTLESLRAACQDAMDQGVLARRPSAEAIRKYLRCAPKTARVLRDEFAESSESEGGAAGEAASA